MWLAQGRRGLTGRTGQVVRVRAAHLREVVVDLHAVAELARLPTNVLANHVGASAELAVKEPARARPAEIGDEVHRWERTRGRMISPRARERL